MPQKKKLSHTRLLRRVGGMMMVLCLLVGGGRLVTGALPIFDPTLASAEVTCTFWECAIDRSPLRLLPQEGGRPRMVSDMAVLEEVVDQPLARTLIAAGALTSALPTALMFLALALAFRSIGRNRNFSKAATWLRRGAVAAIAGVVLQPVAATLRATALSPVSTGEQQLFLMFDGGDFLWGIMLAGTAWVVVWTLEQAVKSERDLAEIV
jgi:hypothetical protein